MLGRQTVSWATTLFLTPADPFSPFDPADPFREYRAGVNAARAQYFAGPFTELDVIVRPAETGEGRTMTALARARTTLKPWDISGWAGVLHDQPAAALAADGSVGAWELRAEATLRGEQGDAVFRGAAGVDRRSTVAGRDLYFVFEYQRDGFGAAEPGQVLSTVASAPYRRGELQVLGRDVIALQATYQLHPLLSTELLALWDLDDRSALVAPALALSASNEITLRCGLFLPTGNDSVQATGPRTEFGVAPLSGYLSVSLFF